MSRMSGEVICVDNLGRLGQGYWRGYVVEYNL